MQPKLPLTVTGAFLALSLMSGTAAFSETAGTENPIAEAQAFLASPTSLAQAIASAEAAAGGKVSSVEFQSGENGAPDLIMAEVILADGSEKTVALNPADGKVMKMTLTGKDSQGDEQHGATESDESGDSEEDTENAND